MMLARINPQEAYRRVDFDARVGGASPAELVALCYEQVISALGSALFADRRTDNRARSLALTRALSGLTALKLGVSGGEGVALALAQFYEASRRGVLDSVPAFDAKAIAAIRQDFIDIARATGAAPA